MLGHFVNVAPEPIDNVGCFRIVANLLNDKIQRLDFFVGYTHKGIEKIIEKNPIYKGLIFADKVFAYPFFGQYPLVLAVEKLMNIHVPVRAQMIRVMLIELERIEVYLKYIGVMSSSSGIQMPKALANRLISKWREMINSLFHTSSQNYFKIGGVYQDINTDFERIVKSNILELRSVLKDLLCLTDNIFFQKKSIGIGVISKQQIKDYGLTGIIARASGINDDVRKKYPYDFYANLDFDIPLKKASDVYSRFILYFDEIYQSLSIVEQLITYMKKQAPNEPILAEELLKEKDFDEKYIIPKGEIYIPTESVVGQTGVYLKSDGTVRPVRCHYRSSSLSKLYALNEMFSNMTYQDLRFALSSLGIEISECDR
ncbi:MAG: hypothetical protein MJ247_04140 [Alphaproteobacteria bacterium]|nr:hypothetical protein [Alphaproteobacteria bacterium]